MEPRSTTVHCFGCGGSHPGVIERRGGQIVGSYACDGQRHEAVLSESAELYETITARSHMLRDPGGEPWPPRAVLNLIEITNTCNFRCPVCYARSGPREEPRFASADEVVEKVRQARALGARGVTLTGGEPTQHPDLLDIVRRVSRLGVRVNMPSNGYRLGTEPDLARRLRRAGLYKTSIQLDTFRPEIHRLIRGNAHVEEKRQAMENARSAGLRLGIIATVTHLNVDDAPALVEFALGFAPALQTIAFQLMSRGGRHEIPPGPDVDREWVIERLIRAGYGDPRSFWPLPRFKPWGMRVHPDCGANLYLLTHGRRRCRLDEVVDLDRFFDHLARSDLPASFMTKNLVPLAHALREAAPARIPMLLAHLRGFLSGKGSRGLVVVGIGGFLREDFYDESRVERCPTTIATPQGPVSPCVHFRGPVPSDNRSPW